MLRVGEVGEGVMNLGRVREVCYVWVKWVKV